MDTDYIEEDELEEPQQLTPFQMFMNENGKVVKAVVATFLLTSLVWVCVFLAIFSSTKGFKQSGDKAVEAAGQVSTAQQKKALAPRYEAKANKDVDYTDVIIGHWEPVEVSAYNLDFSEFGTLKVVTKKHGYTERSEYKYKLLGDQMGYTFMAEFYEGDWHRIEIVTGEDGATYLTVFDDPLLAGRYRRVQ